MFAQFALHERLLKAVAELKFVEPTPVQAAAIPPALEGRDLRVTAQTGSGKTAAFVLPLLNRLMGPSQQRVTIRINPRPAPMPMDAMMFDNGLDEARGPRWIERKMGNCLSAGLIAGVQPIDNSRLLLILNDRRLVTARLEKGCQGRDFYSGFMVQRSDDGMICAGRDMLRSRSGSTCQVTGFRQLVQVGG